MRHNALTKMMASTALVASLGFTVPSFAQDSAGDIIVTARRVEERLQDVPISITVFNQEQIDNANISSARELATYTPSLSTNARFGADSASFAIRGFVQENRTTASVGVYFADVVAPRGGGSVGSGGDGAGPGSMFDLQNVQVLKGPQGTLFGRNTTGGAVLLVPKKPTADFEGYVEGSYGNYDMRRVQAVINVPLADTFYVRAGVDYHKTDGWQKNYTGVGPSRFGDTNYVAARVSTLAQLTPDLENYTIFSYSKSTPNGNRPKATHCMPWGYGFAGAQPLPVGNFACGQIEDERALGRKSVSNWMPEAMQLQEVMQVINTTTWLASDSLTIKNITSYAQVKQDLVADLFGLGFPLGTTVNLPSGTGPQNYKNYNVPTQYQGYLSGSSTVMSPYGYHAGDQSTFTEELQFQGIGLGGRLNWQAGAYAEISNPLGWSGSQSVENAFCASQADINNGTCVNVFPQIMLANGVPLADALTPAYGGFFSSSNYQIAKTKYRNYGLYAQGTFDITDSLKFTAGFRYTWDKTSSEARRATYSYNVDTNGDGLLNDALGVCMNANIPYTVGGQGNVRNCHETMSQKSKAPTWVLGLDYKISSDVLLYAKWARGYRQGATNPYAPVGFYTFEPEKVNSYEIGVKSSWRGSMPGHFNVTAFYNDFKNQQLEAAFLDLTNPFPSGDPRNVQLSPNVAIVNAGKSRIWGVEVESSISPFQGFTISASYAYLNTKLKEIATLPYAYNPADLPTVGAGEYAAGIDGYDFLGKIPKAGQWLTHSPRHKLVLDARYQLPIDESAGRVSLGATYIYTSKIFYGDFGYNSAFVADSLQNKDKNFSFGPATSIVNFNIAWNGIMGSNVDASVFMTNAFNEKYYVDRSSSGGIGYGIQYMGQPRMFGGRIRYNF